MVSWSIKSAVFFSLSLTYVWGGMVLCPSSFTVVADP